MEEIKRQLNKEEYLNYINQWKDENKELIEKGKCRKVFLEILPRKGKLINWKESVHFKIYFIYENIEDWIEIINYNKNMKIELKYLKNQNSIQTREFSNCKLGNILERVTKKFKIEIGTRFQDEKRDITITDREYRIRYDKNNEKHNEKWYKYTCNVCGWTEGWMKETMLTVLNTGCACCAGHKVLIGYNDIPTTAPWMIKYFQGGYDEAKLYTNTGGGNPNNRYGKINPLCPICKQVKNKKINIYNIYNYHSIFCNCSDKVSYPEKICFSILKQLNIEFQTQLSKSTFKWIGDYKYDFYFELDNERYIVETHGLQHYKECTGNWKNKLQEQQKIDKLKKELALQNGIKEENYIIIDCRYSTLDWIRDNYNGILNSRLAELFDLSKIDWLKAEKFACSNLVKIACDYKRNNPDMTTTEIGKIMRYDKSTIIDWLKKGSKLEWCNYDTEEEKRKSGMKSGKKSKKPVEIFKDGISLGIFPSASELCKSSLELFGVKLDFRKISAICLGKYKTHKGYTFKFV